MDTIQESNFENIKPRTCCLIISGYMENIPLEFKNTTDFDFVICADRGFYYAQKLNILPNLLIGDFDSLERDIYDSIPSSIEIFKHPKEKDYTDTLLCLQYALEQDFDELVILGGIGGRLDHSLSNIQSMAWILDEWHKQGHYHKKISMLDGKNRILLIKNSSLNLEASPGTLISLISLSEICRGISTKGLKWTLNDASLSHTMPIGISNEFIDSHCEIRVESGILLIAICRD